MPKHTPWPADAVERRAVASLVPYARNARTHSPAQVDQIAASVREWGWTTPVLVDEDGGIIAGHGRILAAQKLGIAEVPVMVARGWTEAQRRAYVLADNQLAANAGWDTDLLKIELGDLKADGFDLDLIGFDPDALAGFLADPTEGLTDPDETPDPPADPVSVLGDVWLLGKHRIVCGDSTDALAWDRLAPSGRVMVFTSPPYGAAKGAKLRDHYVPGAPKRDSFYGEHEDRADKWAALMDGWTALALAHAECTVCNVQMLADNKRAMVTWLAANAPHLVDVVVWDKTAGPPQMQRNVLTNVFEWVFIMSAQVNASRSLPLADFHGSEGNIVRIGRQSDATFAAVHRATMPLDLADWAMRVPGAKADMVIDPFGGTGTTMIAAERAKMVCGLIEMDAAYVDVAVKRWQEFTGQTATLEADGRTFAEVAGART